MQSGSNSEDSPNEGRAGSRYGWLIALIPAFPIVLISLMKWNAPLQEDEVYWIGSAYYYHLAVEGDWSNPDWQLMPARENPALGKYVIGSALGLAGREINTPDLLGSFYLIFARMPGAWGEGEAYEKRASVARRVDPSIGQSVLNGQGLPLNELDLRIVRGLMCLLGIVSAAGICVLGRQCDSAATGLIAGLLFALHPIVASAYSAAMIDMVAVCFSVWTMVGLIAFWKRTRENGRSLTRQSITIIFLTTAAMTMACGSKMNSLVVVVVAAGVVLDHVIGTFRAGGGRTWQSIVVFALAMLVSLLAFVASNPALHADVLDGLAALSYEHRMTADVQESIDPDGRLHSAWQRIGPLSTLVCGWPGLMLGVLAATIWQAKVSWRPVSPFLLVVLWWLTALVLLLAWLPFAWDRYALPILPPTLLIIGKTFAETAHYAWSKTRNLSQVNTSDTSNSNASFGQSGFAALTGGKYWIAKCWFTALVAAWLMSCIPAIFAYPAMPLPPAYQLKSEQPLADTSLLTIPEHPGERSHGAKLTPRLVSSVALFSSVTVGLHPYLPATIGGLAFLLCGIVVTGKITENRTIALLAGLIFAGLYATNACFSLNFMPKPFDGVAIGFVALTAMLIDRPWLLAISAYLACWTDERAVVSLGLVGVLILVMQRFDLRAKWIRVGILAGAVVIYFVTRVIVSIALGWSAADTSMLGNSGGAIALTHLAAWSCFEGGWLVIGLAGWIALRRQQYGAFALLAAATFGVIASCLIVLDLSRAGSFAFPVLLIAIALLAGQQEQVKSLARITGAAAVISLLVINFEVIAGSEVEPAIIQPLWSSVLAVLYAVYGV